jgi:hypothetical protein
MGPLYTFGIVIGGAILIAVTVILTRAAKK